MEKKKISEIIMNPTIKIIITVLFINIILIIGLTTFQSYNEMKSKAQDFLTQMEMTWDYISDNQDIINYNQYGEYEYKGIHCAIAGVEIADRITNETGYDLRYVTENARSSMNIANLDEYDALSIFRSDSSVTEYIKLELINQSILYIEPIYIEESCLECHGEPAGEIDVSGYAKEGYEIGDIYGAVSVSIPIMPYLIDVLQNVILEVVVFLLLIALSVYILFRIVKHYITTPLANLENEVSKIQDGDFDIDLSQVDVQGELGVLAEQITSMASQLDLLYTDLDGQVELKTEQLKVLNSDLEHQQEMLLTLNDRLQEENTYKSEFLAIMSHELKTPLAAIITFTELLERSNSYASEQDRDRLDEISNNSAILLRLINNILEMARIEAGKSELNTEVVDWLEIWGYLKTTTKPLAEKKSISFTAPAPQNIPLMLGDNDKLRRMVENLLSNAIKYTPEHGAIAMNFIHLAEEHRLKIVVSDNGIGIKEKDIPYIFEKFVQGDSSNSRQSNGTGLGLALAQNIAEMHDGLITFTTREGVGSEFVIDIPVILPNKEEI